jgi:hypothetical protein
MWREFARFSSHAWGILGTSVLLAAGIAYVASSLGARDGGRNAEESANTNQAVGKQ